MIVVGHSMRVIDLKMLIRRRILNNQINFSFGIIGNLAKRLFVCEIIQENEILIYDLGP